MSFEWIISSVIILIIVGFIVYTYVKSKKTREQRVKVYDYSIDERGIGAHIRIREVNESSLKGIKNE